MMDSWTDLNQPVPRLTVDLRHPDSIWVASLTQMMNPLLSQFNSTEVTASGIPGSMIWTVSQLTTSMLDQDSLGEASILSTTVSITQWIQPDGDDDQRSPTLALHMVSIRAPVWRNTWMNDQTLSTVTVMIQWIVAMPDQQGQSLLLLSLVLLIPERVLLSVCIQQAALSLKLCGTSIIRSVSVKSSLHCREAHTLAMVLWGHISVD